MEDLFRLSTAGEILEAALAEQRVHRDPADDSEHARSLSGTDYVEDLVATIMAGVLGVTNVRRDLAFSALGGDSLTATRVLSRVWRTFGVKLALSALIPDASVRTLTETIKHARDASGSTMAPLRRRAASGAEEVSPNQAAIWFVESLGGAGALYNIPYGLRLRGPLEAAKLRRALDRLVQDHEALRLRFEMREGRLLQEACNDLQSIALPIVDLSHVPWTAREEHSLSLASDHIRMPFNLSRAPLLRALLIRLANEDHMLVLAIHHIVCDAWSIKVMMRQLSEHYSGVAEIAPRSPTPGFLDFVAWQRAALDDGELTPLVLDWREALGNFSEVPPFPTDYRRPASFSAVGAVEPVALNPELTARLRSFSGDQGVTLYMTLLCAFVGVLSARTGYDSVIVGSPVANREHESLEEVVGHIANMLPMRVDCGGDPTMRELLGRVRAVALAAYNRQALPFTQLVRELAPSRQPGINPIFQVALILNDTSAPPLGQLRVSELLIHTGTAKLDLTCYLEERAGSLSGYLEYATELFLPETIGHLRLDFESLLGELVDYVDRPLSEVIAKLPSSATEKNGSVEA